MLETQKDWQQITEDILDLSKIESGSLVLKKEKFDIKEKISNIIKDVQKQISNSNELKILFKESRESIFINADKIRIYQVITNLLNNAIKFTKGETISVSTKVTEQQKDKYNEKERRDYSDRDDGISTRQVIVSIKDSGIGIDLKFNQGYLQSLLLNHRQAVLV